MLVVFIVQLLASNRISRRSFPDLVCNLNVSIADVFKLNRQVLHGVTTQPDTAHTHGAQSLLGLVHLDNLLDRSGGELLDSVQFIKQDHIHALNFVGFLYSSDQSWR